MCRWPCISATILAGLLRATVYAAPTEFGDFHDTVTDSRASVAEAIAKVPTNAGVVYDSNGQTNCVQVYNFGSLRYSGPIDVALTLERIRLGCRISTEKHDGNFFSFKQFGVLPNIPRKGNYYYREFVVWPSIDITNVTYDPNKEAFGVVPFPGPMRLLIGREGEVYFTGDHYGDGAQTDAYYVNPPPPSVTFHVTSPPK